ncbi:DUF2334 domain-containing protein [Hufsiella ginkgonis]|uniref:DUF2334 domain-containing protein n=1 Tax=Hufsiella ginkgonis TaxID=2695274 RepID=A0A7K1Y2Z8_9SPHI|nr:DUF2334 domain-containing protein [Hufsiella ginkgonis]MXV17056.1 DUF2334 domain-containing protein [Hufsiella ginkgonis]
MKRKWLAIIYLLAAKQVNGQTKIVLKLDDIGAAANTTKAAAVMDYLVERQVKFTLGVIADRLDSTALNVLGKYIGATNAKGEPLLEIWHHGLDHTNTNPPGKSQEFRGTSYDFQKRHFDGADQRVLKYLGVQMHAFGSPYNAIDSTTLKVVSENPAYNVVMFAGGKFPAPGKLTRLNNRVDMENGTGNTNYAFFVSNYAKSSYKGSNMILQGHPPMWTPEQFGEFKKILDFLISEKCVFVLPGELVQK